MFNEIGRDRYDDQRRAWINRHAWPILRSSQQCRRDLLKLQINDRDRAAAGGLPDPYDTARPTPLLFRRPTTIEGGAEVILVALAGALAPVGWLLGLLLYRRIVTLIPDRLRSYPIPACLWTGAAIGTLTLLLHLLAPARSLTSALFAPYLIAQIPAAFAAAGVLGILNGWLAVPGSTEWYPKSPLPIAADLDLPMRPDDLTAPPLFETIDIDPAPDMRPIRTSSRSPGLVVAGLLACAIGSTLMAGSVLWGLKDVVAQPFSASYYSVQD
jgi:hypothetical protein